MENGKVVYFKFEYHQFRHLLPQIVSCYRDVFASPPWNEWKKCEECGQKWGILSRDELNAANHEHCGKQVVDYWPSDVVMAEISRDLQDKETSCWLAMTGFGQVVGFIWGYPITPEDLAQKLGRPDLASNLIERFGDHERVAYQDEMGVLEAYRSRKIGKELARMRLKDFKQQGLKVGVVRTKTIPPTVTYNWYTRDGFETVSSYDDRDGRVVLARSYEGYYII